MVCFFYFCNQFLKMRYFIDISYDGSNYHGWQIQPNAVTVQHQINLALSTILNEEINVLGAGRTDAGVHAKKMIAHFDTNQAIDFHKFKYRVNGFLKNDISGELGTFFDCIPVDCSSPSLPSESESGGSRFELTNTIFIFVF